MNLKKVALVAAVLLAVVLIGLWLRSPGGERRAEGRVDEPILQAAIVDDLARLTFDNGEDQATLRRTDSGWVVEEQFDYPVEQQFLMQYILKLNELRLERRVTAKSDVFGDLGVLRPLEVGGKREETRTGIEFRALNADDEPLIEVVFGNRRETQGAAGASGAGGMYMRDLVDDTVYVLSGAPRVMALSKDWVRGVILDFNPKMDLKSFSVSRPGADPLVLHRVGDPPEESDFDTKVEWRLEGLDDDSALNHRNVLEVAKGLGDLFLVEVADPALTAEDHGRTETSTVEVELFDKRHFLINIGEEPDGEQYRTLTIEAIATDPEDDELQQQVEAFNSEYKGRIFRIHGWTADRALADRETIMVKS